MILHQEAQKAEKSPQRFKIDPGAKTTGLAGVERNENEQLSITIISRV